MSQGQESEEVHEEHGIDDALPLLKRWHLSAAKQYYSYAKALGFGKLQDYFQGAQLSANGGPVWVLGEKYELSVGADCQEQNEKVMADVLLDFTSRLWMTYRQGCSSIGTSCLTSDAGWGCTLRSGQMLLAQVLLHHTCGRQWRRSKEIQEHSDVAQLLALFWDDSAQDHPYSIHNLVAVGKKFGIVAGEWLGPWTLSHTLASVVNQHNFSGLHVHLANTPGGSAPVLYTACVESIFHGEDGNREEVDSEKQLQSRSVMILIPLVLGIGKVNPRYLPQLRAVLEWPQSSGIVGGRPSSSLYFIGHQDDSILFLDPHTLQERGSSWKEAKESYFCSHPRAMQADYVDPSLAIGFYCRTLDSFHDLASRLKALEQLAEGAPLINIVEGMRPLDYKGTGRQSSMDAGGHHGDEPWELL